MNSAIQRALEEHGGVATRAQLLAAASRSALGHAVAAGHIRLVHPRVYAAATYTAEREIQLRAAVRYADDQAALSHLTALEVWGLPTPPGAVHLMTGRDLRPGGGSGLIVHQRTGFACEPPLVVVRGGLPVTRLETSIADSWSLLDAEQRRAPAIIAVQRRMTTPARLLEAALAVPNLPGRAQLLHLTDLLATGCRSELEIWGYERVFRHPALPPAVHQLPVKVGSTTFYLDLAYEEEMVAVELDGRLYHSSPEQHERDLRRDSALAAMGWGTIRFTHPRLRDEHSAVEELLRVLETRRRQLRIA